jgi:signal transduction histidine kinase
MKIQQKKAQDQGIEFLSTFNGIGVDIYQVLGGEESPMIISDENRVMQVLLGLQSNALKFT